MNVLYKYVDTWDAVCKIASGSLKFTPPKELNDPTELVPLMTRHAVSASLASLRKSGYSRQEFDWLGHQEALLRLLCAEMVQQSRPSTIEMANATLLNSRYDDLDLMESYLTEVINRIRSDVGVFSATCRPDSLPMWAHYAAKAEGYVVRFEGLERIFAGDDTGSLNALKPVCYVQDITGLTFVPSSQDNLFFCKFDDWKYEQEWRVVRALKDCIEPKKGLYCMQIDKARVTGVIAGWNVPAQHARQRLQELGEVNPSAQMRFASLQEGKVVLSDSPR